MKTTILSMSYPRDNGLNVFRDFDTLTVKVVEISESAQEFSYSLIDSRSGELRNLNREEFLACCENLFYEWADKETISPASESSSTACLSPVSDQRSENSASCSSPEQP